MLYTKPEPGKPVILEIAGKNLELRFSLKVLKALDVEQQISMLKGEGLGDTLRDPGKLAVVLYYGVRAKNPEITEDWIEENIDASMLLDIAPALAYACTGRWPDMDKLLPNAERPTNPTGSPSGPLAATTSAVVKTNSGA